MTLEQAASMLLYAEDDAIIQSTVQEALEEAGFHVTVAANGTAAAGVFDKNADGFQGLITDIKLGRGLDGWELARHAREKNPKIAVVYVSGDSGPDWAAKGVPQSVMVSKPFATAQIVVAISSLLVTPSL